MKKKLYLISKLAPNNDINVLRFDLLDQKYVINFKNTNVIIIFNAENGQ